MKTYKFVYLIITSLLARVKRVFRKEPLVYFTSDTHFGHRNVILYCDRPFSSVKQMDWFLKFQWNCYIAPTDTVMHLGDVGINVKTARRISQQLNGEKYLVSGNHDETFKFKNRQQKTVDDKVKAVLESGWMGVYQSMYIPMAPDVNLVLTHLPPKKLGHEAYDDRYMEERTEHNPDVIHLHGHLHAKYIKSGNLVDVCWDAHKRPITIDEVYAIYKNPKEFIPSNVVQNKERYAD